MQHGRNNGKKLLAVWPPLHLAIHWQAKQDVLFVQELAQARRQLYFYAMDHVVRCTPISLLSFCRGFAGANSPARIRNHQPAHRQESYPGAGGCHHQQVSPLIRWVIL